MIFMINFVSYFHKTIQCVVFNVQYYLLSNQMDSGDNEIRTRDPLLARQVLSQLSYTPRVTSLHKKWA